MLDINVDDPCLMGDAFLIIGCGGVIHEHGGSWIVGFRVGVMLFLAVYCWQ